MSWAVRTLVNLTPRRRLLPAKDSRSTLDKMMSLYRLPRALSASRESGKAGQPGTERARACASCSLTSARATRREETWKTTEILILRHQLAALQRHQPRRPKLNWADRALLAALLGTIPKARHRGLRLLVTPDTILRWHREIARRHWAARSMRGKTGRPATRRNQFNCPENAGQPSYQTGTTQPSPNSLCQFLI